MGLSGFAKFLQPDKTNSKRRL